MAHMDTLGLSEWFHIAKHLSYKDDPALVMANTRLAKLVCEARIQWCMHVLKNEAALVLKFQGKVVTASPALDQKGYWVVSPLGKALVPRRMLVHALPHLCLRLLGPTQKMLVFDACMVVAPHLAPTCIKHVTGENIHSLEDTHLSYSPAPDEGHDEYHSNHSVVCLPLRVDADRVVPETTQLETAKQGHPAPAGCVFHAVRSVALGK